MTGIKTIKINFRGGIISPGELFNVLVAAGKAGIAGISFGLRQQLLLKVEHTDYPLFARELHSLGVAFETDNETYPNVVSSYAAEDIFISNTWLREGVYKDIFDLMDYRPRLKINISNSNQSFTPMLTGNINWVASPVSAHFWHLFIRFPKTNMVYEWDQLVYTNNIPSMSKEIERIIMERREDFFDNPLASGGRLMAMFDVTRYIVQRAEKPAVLPAFKLPYYEGINRYNDKYWLGIYKRNEQFSIAFLKDMCRLCLDTKIGQLCSTPWKSIIVKGILEKDLPLWNSLLAKHMINVRHAANELNFQVEDDCLEGLELKNYLVKQLSRDDTRTTGLCFGIKTRKKSEVFSSILVRRKSLLTIAGRSFLHVYDILCAHDFNPNERTAFVYSRNNPKPVLAEQLRRAIYSYYDHHRSNHQHKSIVARPLPEKNNGLCFSGAVYECPDCLSVYDEEAGEPFAGILPGTKFSELPDNWCCPTCETPKQHFRAATRTAIGSETI